MTDLKKTRNREELMKAWKEESHLQELNLTKVRTNMQPRVEGTDEEILTGYTKALQNGAEYPPVDVFEVGGEYILTDGYHRYFAHQKDGRTSIRARIYKNRSKEDALVHSSFANVSNGKSQSQGDLKQAVRNLLKTPNLERRFRSGFDLKTQAIADWAGVSRSTVYAATEDIRNQLKHEEYLIIKDLVDRGESHRSVGKQLGKDGKTIKRLLTAAAKFDRENSPQAKAIKGIPQVETEFRIRYTDRNQDLVNDDGSRPAAVLQGMSYLSIGSGMDHKIDPEIEQVIDHIKDLDHDTKLLALRDVKASIAYLTKLSAILEENGLTPNRKYPKTLMGNS